MIHVLVVDDDLGVRKSLRYVLEARGYECEEAEDGAVALAKLRTGEVELVLTDYRMPVMDGLQFLEYLHLVDASDHEAPPVILLCGNMTQTVRERALRAGAWSVLKKPYNLNELLATVSAIVKCQSSRRPTSTHEKNH